MMNKFPLTWLMAMLLSIGCQQVSQETIKKEELSQDIIKKLDEKIPMWQQEYQVPCVGVGIIEDGKIKLAKVYGSHQKGKKAPQNTIFNVASITKSLVATTTLKLVEQGKWDLDEPLHHYWTDPDLKDHPYAKLLTTRHSLNHTTGFKNWRRMTGGKLSFDFKPGEQFQYSGEGLEYLQHALEQKFNTRLDSLVDQVLFKPLKMDDSQLVWNEQLDSSRFAYWHDHEGKAHDVSNRTPWVTAADDLLITVKDLATFGIHVMNGADLSDSLFAEMIRPQSKIHNNASMGLGWTVAQGLPNGEYLLNHDGGDLGVATTYVLLPQSKRGVIVFTNGDNGRIICNNVLRASMDIGPALIKKLYWGSEPPAIIQLDTTLLAEYAGMYATSNNQSLQFIKSENSLKMNGGGIPQVPIFPSSPTTFFPLNYDIHFIFLRNEEGRIIGFEAKQEGNVILSGTRE